MRSFTIMRPKRLMQVGLGTSSGSVRSRLNTLILIIGLTFPACKEKLTDKQFEQKVLDEVFVKLVDSTYKDKRIYASSPEFGEWIFDKNGRVIGRDTTGQHLRDLAHAKKVAALERDTFGLVIAVGSAALINEKTDLQKYSNRKFIFKDLSELPESADLENWSTKYTKFAGLLLLSKVKFNNKKECGTLEISYHCGVRCGLGYLVTIRKIDDKWVISNVKNTWIS